MRGIKHDNMDNQKKHIVILSLAYKPIVSGAERFVVETVKRLSSEYRFTIITARFKRSWPRIEEQHGVRIIRVGFGLPRDADKYLYPFLAAWTTFCLQPDLVHAVMESFAGIALVVYRFFCPATPTLLNLQSGSIDTPRVHAKAPEFLLRWIHRAPQKIHAISRALADRARAYGASDVTVIPNGIDLEPFVRVRGTSKQPGLIVAVGRLHNDKGYDVLIKAFAQALTREPNLQLQIAGEGEERSMLEALIKTLKLEGHVTLLGQTNYHAIPTLIASAELFVTPSRAEGMGIVFVEAQAAGTAVIGTNIGGIPDVIENGVTGILVPSQNVEALAQAINHLMEDAQERARLVENAIHQLDRFTWDRVVHDIKNIYEETLIEVSHKRILICTGIYPPEIGGPSTVIATTVERLRQQGYQVYVITYGDPNPSTSSGNNIERVSRQGSIITRYLGFARAVRSNLIPGMTVVATDVYSVGLPVRLALIGRHNRLLLRLGGEWRWERAVESQRFFGTLREFWSRSTHVWRDVLEMWIYGWVMGRAERMAVTSRLLKEILTPLNQKWIHKIDIIPNQAYAIDHRKRSTDPPHQPLRLIYVGRFVRVKNLLFLAHVLRAAIVKSGQAIRCTFVGDGPVRAEVEKTLRDIPDMVFVGTKNSYEVASLLVDADILVLPSLSDLYPNVVIEALAHGVPVLCTSEHGLSSDLGGVHFLSPKDEEVWKREITSLMDPSRYEALRSTIHLPCEQEFDFTNWVIASAQTQ